ncbi:M6 family metalloprotease domain-containing protein [Streptomyces sp. NBC_00094]|uniref:M6 family metalloprotease domain-containing protein n=1 Tax=Streptomyces sp. NBC_00094 TaxID=2903620 RepID=UPI002253A961|nr:M6 family metalloprotease domain-containing protein [Streptomyces sp. NBC_00094]MCX5393748.1 M6 family metalloprotease domain-containing protein [Streptomyces sp. NBC_00094]
MRLIDRLTASRGLLPALAAALLLLPLGTPPARAADGPSACALPGATGWTDEGHDTDYSVFQRPVGTIKVGMIFVDFPDARATEAPGDDAAQITPGADWLWNASYGRTWLSISRHQQWVRMPRASTDYGFARGLTHATHEAYIRDAVAAADPYVDFSGYDMVYVVPTRNAAAISFTPTYVYEPGTAGVVADGRRVRWAVTFGQDMWHWGAKLVAHETAHTFGLPDLYAFDAGGDAHRFIGGWDVMGLVGGRGSQFFAWHSWKLGWTADNQVVCRATKGSDTVYLTAVEYGSGTKMAVIRTGPTTAYVVESRRGVQADAGSCSTGALVYRVDSSVWTGYGPVTVMDAKPTATPAAGCRPLDDAPFWVGESFTDAAAGVRIDVLGADGYGETVRITKS